jgi:hypothetical protein
LKLSTALTSTHLVKPALGREDGGSGIVPSRHFLIALKLHFTFSLVDFAKGFADIILGDITYIKGR